MLKKKGKNDKKSTIIKEGKEPIKKEKDVTISAKDTIEDHVFFPYRKSVKEQIAPIGVNPNPLDFMVLIDNETNIFTLCYYIHKMPKHTTFATTFSALFNYPNVTSSVFISPMLDGKASKLLDKRITSLETELIAARKAGDVNRIRKLELKTQETSNWARDIESGHNSLFEVAFLFVLQDTSLEQLRVKASEFHSRAREKGIDLVACYSAHPEAFVSAYPTNRIFYPSLGPLKGLSIKRHVMDKRAVATLFNHTRYEFSHKNGIVIGHNLSSGQLILYDPYDSSHDGYGVIVVGKTGSGKSATVKMLTTRFIDFDYKIRSIDFEPKGSVGEYSTACLAVGGINYQIHAKSDNIFNLFELDKEEIFDETTNTEYEDLRLSEMLSNLQYLQIALLKKGSEITDFSLLTFIKAILDEINHALFAERGIIDGKVESLYTSPSSFSSIHSGKVKKTLPTITEFYKKLLVASAQNENPHLELAYEIMIAGYKDYVRELYYCKINKEVLFFSKEEYEAFPINSAQQKQYTYNKKEYPIIKICGNKPYFDGQSTIVANSDTPWINIDISQLPTKEREIAILIGQNYLGESCVKKNSQNPKKASKMIVLIDELHKLFPIEEARRFIADAYRTYRKRNVSPWAITQFLSDFDGYDDTKALLKNATSIFMLKQEFQDKDFLRTTTPLTDSQIEKVCSLGHGEDEDSNSHKGELCLIDNNRVCFLKIDYLTGSESLVVETDINKIKTMYTGSLFTS